MDAISVLTESLKPQWENKPYSFFLKYTYLGKILLGLNVQKSTGVFKDLIYDLVLDREITISKGGIGYRVGD